jgi:hypothetical protein
VGTDGARQPTRRGSSVLINDDNRLQAYGWSLSSKSQLKLADVNGKVQVNVPVPVYCRPIFNTTDKTQVCNVQATEKGFDGSLFV